MLFRCSCGFRCELSADDFPLQCACGKFYRSLPGENALPPLSQRLSAWKAAAIHWHDAGKPSRSNAEVDAIFEQACRPCDRFNGKSCTLCGCSVNKSETALRNKIRMATEVCPLGKWGDETNSSVIYAEPKLRHLLYHVCPFTKRADGMEGWRRNLRQLFKRWDTFNGRKIIAVVTGEYMESPKRVIEEFAGRDIQTIFTPNDPELREAATFKPLLEALHATAPLDDDVFFYAHTKGNSTNGNRDGAIYWRNAAYKHLLDRADECMQALTRFPAVGTHKMVWGDRPCPYPNGLAIGEWMFAGTFFWLRCGSVFSHPAWRNVPIDRYGAEAYPSTLFDVKEAHSMFQLWAPYIFPSPSPYNPRLYRGERITDEPLE